MRGIRCAAVMTVGLLVAPVALRAQANQNQMCPMLGQTIKFIGGKLVMVPGDLSKKMPAADPAAEPSSSPTNGSTVTDSGKIEGPKIKKPVSRSITCTFGATPAATDSASKKTGADDSASHGNVADTANAAGAKKP